MARLSARALPAARDGAAGRRARVRSCFRMRAKDRKRCPAACWLNSLPPSDGIQRRSPCARIKFVDGLEAARVKSFDGAVAPGPTAAP